jgi:hypothetical protein
VKVEESPFEEEGVKELKSGSMRLPSPQTGEGLGGEGDCCTATMGACLPASGAFLQPLLGLDAICIVPLTPNPFSLVGARGTETG